MRNDILKLGLRNLTVGREEDKMWGITHDNYWALRNYGIKTI